MRNTLALLLLFSQCASTHAALGGAPAELGATQAGRTARVMAAGAGSYRMVETTLASGTVIHEYVTQGGVVFAVSWKGPFLPDLRTLLGKHFDTLTREAARRPKAGHSSVHVERPDVVIVSGGHMRAYAGQAWVAGEFPAGFAADDID